MFEQLLQLAQNHIGESINGQSDVPQEQQGNVVNTTSESIVSTIMEQVGGGNMSGVMEMLSGKETQAGSPAVNSIAENVITSLMTKNGLSQSAAASIAQTAIPAVMNMLNGKINNAQASGGMDIAGMLGGLTGGGHSAGGASDLIGGLLNNFMGGDKKEEGAGESNPQSAITNILSNLLK
jgi:hypothetical protein